MDEAQVAQNYQDLNIRTQDGIKSKIYDILGIVIIFALMTLSIGAIEHRAIGKDDLLNLITECVPMFIVAMLLNSNYYRKGAHIGKNTKVFVQACRMYSGYVDNLTNDQISTLDDFCQYFNENALEHMQFAYLKRAAIPYDVFNAGTDDLPPLKTWSKKDLLSKYGKERTKWILKARKCKIKGLKTNILLGTTDTHDITDVGSNELELSRNRKIYDTVSFLISTAVLSLIAVKNITEWGWAGIILVIFKVIYIFARSYMSYFKGYDDITIHVVKHTNRKSDIMRHFHSWYDRTYVKKKE